MHPFRKLLALGLNEVVGRGLVSLTAPGEDDSGHLAAEIVGRPSVVIWQDIGHGELRLSVWWDLDMSRHPQADLQGRCRERFRTAAPLAKRARYPEFVGATASCWVERRDGAWLQGDGHHSLFETYARRGSRAALEAMPDPVPMGFAVNGRFYL